MPGVARIPLMMFTLAVTCGLAACVGGDPDAHPPTVGQPNPAAVFCEQQGGTHDLAAGSCTLEDGSVVDAWEFYRESSAGADG